jgi:hypothetical protein
MKWEWNLDNSYIPHDFQNKNIKIILRNHICVFAKTKDLDLKNEVDQLKFFRELLVVFGPWVWETLI